MPRVGTDKQLGSQGPGARVGAGDQTLGGARPISCPSCSGVAGPWGPWASIPEAFLNQRHPLEGILLSLCKQGGCPMAHGLLCEIHLWKKITL